MTRFLCCRLPYFHLIRLRRRSLLVFPNSRGRWKPNFRLVGGRLARFAAYSCKITWHISCPIKSICFASLYSRGFFENILFVVLLFVQVQSMKSLSCATGTASVTLKKHFPMTWNETKCFFFKRCNTRLALQFSPWL